MRRPLAPSWNFIPLILILCAVVMTFWQVSGMSYVLWDDDLLITDNEILRLPFAQALRASFLGYYNGDYMPITLMSYWTEIKFAGYQSSVQHLSNLLIHCINVVLCWIWLNRLLPNKFAVVLSVLFFALHPLQVESVAWISERKGLLATTFYLASLLAFEQRSKTLDRRFLWSGLYLWFYLLAVMTKANGVFLPIWVALSVCLLERRLIPKDWRLHLIASLLMLAAVFVRVSAYASAVPQLGTVMLTPERIVGWPKMILTSIGFYIHKFFVPTNLSIIYPSYFASGGWELELAVGSVFAALLSAVMWLRRRQDLIVWLMFLLLSLAPVMNLVPRINFVNDRYFYLPIIALGVMMGTLVTNVRALVAVAITAGSALAFASFHRTQVWHDNVSLWSDTVQKVPQSSLAFNNLGQAFQERGEISQAITNFQKSLSLADSYLANLAINNLATIYSSKQYPEYLNLPLAKSLLEDGIAKVARPDDSLVLRYNLALVELQMGDVPNGIKTLEDLRLKIGESSNQRYRFLLSRVIDLQDKLRRLP